ncbi:hypothetical protein CHLNCDRAFT_140897 [Chlorella variabilis]|uniref:Fungal lipase-type domain-containing protein n=1 Tax=Chlorella variabilis TaxID=554065 RepID=E1Z6G8_CHLVA|nr:hypothetical protein CHLNCDRAFT_140897 [Chlorella variabilis]EFN58927.1 hypothetical protein CHLNCDRAFT_140897 [Chlorella variabilis]|eukprot:XP_005851029.1 hypothetical protein CHLNCDRAFT_140897 [Chlorella variabilis]
MGGAAPNPAPAGGAGSGKVLLRIEYISDAQAKLVVLGPIVADQAWFLKNNYLEAVSSVFAGACLAASLLTLGVLGRNVLRARRLRWSPLRKKAVAFATLPLLLEMVSLSFWLTNMLLSWTRPCSWFHIPIDIMAGLQWSCWNALLEWGDDLGGTGAACAAHVVGAAGQVLASLPEVTHLEKGVGAVCEALPTQALAGAAARLEALERRIRFGVLAAVVLLLWLPTQAVIVALTAWSCQLAGSMQGLTWALGALLLTSALAFLAFTWLAFHQLAARPYRDYRNLALRLALKTRLLTYLTFVLSLALMFYIRSNDCNSTVLIWLGFGPMHVAMTGTVVVESLLFMPSAPNAATAKLHHQLQQFAWTEAQLPGLLERRGLPEEPCFCLETTLKAAYFSLHVYRHFNPNSHVTSLAGALRLYRLQHYEWLREPAHDSNCLLAWGPDTLVAWRIAHPPRLGSLLLGSRPLVHLGFLKSWVLQRIREVLEERRHTELDPLACTADRCCTCEPPPDGHLAAAREAAAAAQRQQPGGGTGGGAARMRIAGPPFRILLAGHSLGGAMSQLCGMDLAAALPGWGFALAPAAAVAPAAPPPSAAALPAVSLTTVTFGAPRTGNHAFAREYDAALPDCWSIINGQDVVANQAKFLVLFKRAGKPVLLSGAGDLLVRPSRLEHSAQRASGASISHHKLLGSYCPSLATFLAHQSGGKPLPGGREAVEDLWRGGATAQLLEQMLGMVHGSGGGNKTAATRGGSPKAADSDALDV